MPRTCRSCLLSLAALLLTLPVSRFVVRATRRARPRRHPVLESELRRTRASAPRRQRRVRRRARRRGFRLRRFRRPRRRHAGRRPRRRSGRRPGPDPLFRCAAAPPRSIADLDAEQSGDRRRRRARRPLRRGPRRRRPRATTVATDLAIGVPSEDFDADLSVGAVHVLYGSELGLTGRADDDFFHQGLASINGLGEAGDRFGAAARRRPRLRRRRHRRSRHRLARRGHRGRNGDRRRRGARAVRLGRRAGDRRAGPLLPRPGVERLAAGDGEEIGAVLAAGEWNPITAGRELAIGVPFHDIDDLDQAGAVLVVSTSPGRSSMRSTPRQPPVSRASRRSSTGSAPCSPAATSTATASTSSRSAIQPRTCRIRSSATSARSPCWISTATDMPDGSRTTSTRRARKPATTSAARWQRPISTPTVSMIWPSARPTRTSGRSARPASCTFSTAPPAAGSATVATRSGFRLSTPPRAATASPARSRPGVSPGTPAPTWRSELRTTVGGLAATGGVNLLFSKALFLDGFESGSSAEWGPTP